MSKPVKVGVTGGIGSGKSIVCRLFSLLDVAVYDADSRAKWLMTHDPLLREGILALFGDQAYREEQLNRTYIASLTFKDPSLLAALNKLVHPAVGRDFDAWFHTQVSGYVIKEAALLIESGSYKQLDFLISVQAPESLRLRRVLSRDAHRDSQQIRDIMRNQLTDEQRAGYADFIIENDDHHMIIPRVLEADRRIRDLAG